jgi:hypothetical protein
MLIGTTGLVWFEDPVIGDQLAVAVAYGPSSSSPTPRDFVEASLPATAHGLAIAPKSDSVLVTLEGERVVVSMASAAQSVNARRRRRQRPRPRPRPIPAFIDFAGWGAARGEPISSSSRRLESAAASLDPSTPPGASAALDLAFAFISATTSAHEALGVLKVALH